MKRKIATFTVAAFALAASISMASSSVAKPAVSAEKALVNLKDGNKRYISHKMKGTKLCDAPSRQKLAATQSPYAIIVSCSDSRVPPEIIFDAGLGELFVVRVAGNVADPVGLGSIEYAVEHLGATLIVVLGHERCGAVTATVDAQGAPEGNIGAIIKNIAPAAEKAKVIAHGKGKSEVVECAVDENIKHVAAAIVQRSSVIAALVEKKKVKIIPGKYDLDDGKVNWF